MRVYIQWALATPGDWVQLDARTAQTIRQLPKKSEPTGNETLDNTPGWVNAINVQGIIFSGYDHIGVNVEPSGLRVTGWVDDPEDFGDTRWATSWLLERPGPDPALGGQINTRQTRTIYATPDAAAQFPGVEIRPWSEFVPPHQNFTMHGIWLPDPLFAEHRSRRALHGWREWIE